MLTSRMKQTIRAILVYDDFTTLKAIAEQLNGNSFIIESVNPLGLWCAKNVPRQM